MSPNAMWNVKSRDMRGSRPENALLQRIERDGVVGKGDRLVVGLSGGCDSVALAAVLAAVAVPMELDLTFAHVNHGLRASAWQDEAIALRVAAAFGIPIAVRALHGVAPDEAALRDARYGALAAIARERGATAVCVAHHAQDQAETVVLALLRGAGPDGLAGMPAKRELAPGIALLRPFLRVDPGELRYYCHVHALPYAVDPTNASADRRRNAVRATLEALRPYFPGLDGAVARSADVIAQELAGTRRATLRREVREALRERDNLRDVDFLHIESVVRTLESGGSGRFHMKAGVALRVERGRIATVERES